jgi:hypothetical protein
MIDINSNEMKNLLDYAKLKKQNQVGRNKIIDLGPFYCKICGNEFLYKSNVNSHMKKNIKCNIIRSEKELKEVLNTISLD